MRRTRDRNTSCDIRRRHQALTVQELHKADTFPCLPLSSSSPRDLFGEMSEEEGEGRVGAEGEAEAEEEYIPQVRTKQAKSQRRGSSFCRCKRKEIRVSLTALSFSSSSMLLPLLFFYIKRLGCINPIFLRPIFHLSPDAAPHTSIHRRWSLIARRHWSVLTLAATCSWRAFPTCLVSNLGRVAKQRQNKAGQAERTEIKEGKAARLPQCWLMRGICRCHLSLV